MNLQRALAEYETRNEWRYLTEGERAILAAARRWLDPQPDENGVYKTETVERIEQALKRRAGLLTLVTRGDAVAVLDALNEADPLLSGVTAEESE